MGQPGQPGRPGMFASKGLLFAVVSAMQLWGSDFFFCGQELFGLYKFTGTHDVKRLVDEVVIMISHYESAMQEATLW